MRPFLPLLAASATTIAVLATPVLTGCPASACPMPKTSTLTITPNEGSPAVPACLSTKLTSCAHPTVELYNSCDVALYVPVDYGIFVEKVTPGTELEVRAKQNLVYEIKSEKATSRTSKQEDYTIPFRLGKDAYTMAFSAYADS
ncbi:hypothetical protein [Pendulispora albinea]|uniref:Lipoprotein n=1 Tax=Pendulispora albinea TaxID=2741071 RepID=A0ABZ2LVH2_9BACT